MPVVNLGLNVPAPEPQQTTSKQDVSDILGAIGVRLGYKRNNYRVEPGLYKLGNANEESPVFASANYKLSFDHLRSALKGLDSWIIVLDTRGINVWCAAGKGTFSEIELARQVHFSGLAGRVKHRRIIIPQLGAPGFAAWRLPELCGFTAEWGPVRARDILPWLEAGHKADESMRQVRFTLGDRLVLSPMELVQAWPFLLAGLGLSFLLVLPNSATYMSKVLVLLLWWVSALLSGGMLFPALLPFLPFRYFGLKALILGCVHSGIFILLSIINPLLGFGQLIGASLFSIGTQVWMGMNFTGCSTFTSPTGAQQEVKVGLPLVLAALVLGFLAFGFDIVRSLL